MTRPEILARIRDLVRETKRLRKQLRGSPAQVFRGPTRKQDRAAKRKTAAERRLRVYAEVDARSGGRCERGGIGEVPRAAEHDHAWGRGKAPETVETIWHLCCNCHFRKTRNEPSRIFWLNTFREHCERHGYTAQVAKCDRERARIEGKGRTT